MKTIWLGGARFDIESESSKNYHGFRLADKIWLSSSSSPLSTSLGIPRSNSKILKITMFGTCSKIYIFEWWDAKLSSSTPNDWFDKTRFLSLVFGSETRFRILKIFESLLITFYLNDHFRLSRKSWSLKEYLNLSICLKEYLRTPVWTRCNLTLVELSF